MVIGIVILTCCFIKVHNIKGLDMKNLQSLKKSPWFSAIAMGVGLAFASSGFAADAKVSTASATTAAAAKEHKKAPSFLFVVSADKAKISHIKDGKYSLEIQKSDMNKVIEFSDRPYRIVKYITGSDLQKIWGEGKDSFAVDPPNAVLSAANQKPIIVVLDGMHRDKSHVTFHFTSTHEHTTGSLSYATLTIDKFVYKYKPTAGLSSPLRRSNIIWQ